MTRDEWKALKKEKGMKVYVPNNYAWGRYSIAPKGYAEYTLDTIYPNAAICRRVTKSGWKVEYDFFPCEMLYTAAGIKEKWGFEV